MLLDVGDDDTDVEEEEGETVAYDANCNTPMHRRGHMRLCKDGMTSETLEKIGWTRMQTSGRNSYIFKRRYWILKIVKHYTARNSYCRSVLPLVERIQLLCDNMGSFAPRVRSVRICDWNGEPALALMMRDEGDTQVDLPSVTETQIRSVVQRLVRSGIMSLDIVTETARINTGNLAFRLSPAGRTLTVRFLDVDVPENFMNTTLVPAPVLERVWDAVVRACLQRPYDPISYADLDALSSAWTPLFT